jgi:hypothetical protein
LTGCFLATLIYARYFSSSYSSLDSSFSSVTYKRKLRKLSTQVTPLPMERKGGRGNWSIEGRYRRTHRFDLPLSEEESDDETDSIIPKSNDDDSESKIDYDQILSSNSSSSHSSLEDKDERDAASDSPFPSDHSSTAGSVQYSQPIGVVLSASNTDADEDADVIRGVDDDSSSSSSFSSLNDSFMEEYEEYSSEKHESDQENDEEEEEADLLNQELELPQLFSDLV